MNRDVLNAGGGLAAQTVQEWEQALRDLLGNETAADRLGQTGRAVTVRDYSVDSLAPRLAALLEGVRR
jgi:glycosyltransferase involved in cell wall biosynthesis